MKIDNITANGIYNMKNQGGGGYEPMPVIKGSNGLDEGFIFKEIEKLHKEVDMDNTRVQFSIHEATKQIMVKVIDNHTEEIVKEIPPEKILDMVANMMERAGLIVDKKV